MESHTNREYLTWTKWLEDQWNEPTRSDYLLMRIAQRVQQVLAKKPNKVRLEDQKVPFQFSKSKDQSREKAVKQSRSHWLAAVGITRKKKSGC